MEKVVMQVGEYRGANFDQLLAAVVRHNLSIGKEHKIEGQKPQRLYLVCSLCSLIDRVWFKRVTMRS